MLKFLIILGLAVYIVYKISSFFFKAGAASQKYRNFQHSERDTKASKKSAKKVGDYIDYEEVK